MVHTFWYIPLTLTLLAVFMLTAGATVAAEPWQAKDLNPVKTQEAPKHEPLKLVENGQAKMTVCVMVGRTVSLNQAISDLEWALETATGAKIQVVDQKVQAPAIVIGDCDVAARNGLVSKDMPTEGFAIKTTGEYVLIVGNRYSPRADGNAWGVYEFLERFVGFRNYWPLEGGRFVPKAESIVVPPVHLSDAPVFAKREIWPEVSDSWSGTGTRLAPLHISLRAADSWPVQLIVHAPIWGRDEQFTKEHPEVFQLEADGKRNTMMLCYGNPQTLATYLEQIDLTFGPNKKATLPPFINGDSITVSPYDMEISCRCDDCRRLWDEKGGQYGSASKIMASFVSKLSEEVKKRWPGKTIIFLPYLNYTQAPEGFEFADNVQVQLCGMPGLAMYKEPSTFAEEQKNIKAWMKLTGKKIQNWHYSCWPEDRTKAVFAYPHAVKQHYQANRDNTVGTFINGVTDHWPRQSLTLYCWLKVLWNPDYDVDAAIEAYCNNLFGPVAKTMREVVGIQIDGWENSRWPNAKMTAKAVYEISYPKERIERLRELLDQARADAKDDPATLRRLEYFGAPFAAMFEEHANYASGNVKPLIAQRVGENPVIDGKLDDAVWQRAEAVPFMMAMDRQNKVPAYATAVQAVWTVEGVTFGFRMSEPTPDRLEMETKGRDGSLIWWDDNIELLLDVTGKNEGEYYHFIVTAANAIAEFKGKDMSWNTDKIKTAAFVGKDFWSLEVYMPFDTFGGEALKPGSGTATKWTGNFTRHRVADAGQSKKFEPLPGSHREYQRLNTTYANFSNNLSDFGPIIFAE